MKNNQIEIEILSWLAWTGTGLKNQTIAKFCKQNSDSLAAIEWVHDQSATLTEQGESRLKSLWESLMRSLPIPSGKEFQSLDEFKVEVSRGYH